MLKVSVSRIRLWRRCHKAHDYRYNQKLRKKIKKRALHLGTIIHEGVEAWLLGKGFKKILKKHKKELDKVFIEEREELGLDNLIEVAGSILEEYTENYKNDNLKYQVIEGELTVPLIPRMDIYFTGKIDALVEDIRGRKWIFERKSCRTMPTEEVRMSDLQTVMYWWAVPQAYPGFEPAGVIWDYVRTKPPAIPEELQKGGLSKRKNIDTLKSVYAKAIRERGLKMKDYADILKDLEGNEEKFFRRIRLPFSKPLRDQVVEDTKMTAIEIAKLGTVLKDRNLRYDCDSCDYFSICQAELRGLDAEMIRKREYTVGEKK